jgi:sulfite reductase alpha subunit-like flavoprotein
LLIVLQAYENSLLPVDTFSLYTAFSREQDQKIYVQDLLQEHAAELRDLVLRKNAHVYVCGDASRMAKDVFKAFTNIVAADGEGSSFQAADSYLREVKKAGRWSEDVW